MHSLKQLHAGGVPPAVTIAASEWALDHILRYGGSGYLPRRIAQDKLASGRLRVVADTPIFRRRIYVVENVQTVRNWSWYGAALAMLEQGCGQWPVWDP